MGEPNQTVDPFLSAGIRLPTQGVGYDGVDDPINPVIQLATAIAGAVIPRDQALNPMSITIPFAAVGDILEVDCTGTFASDLTSGTPATFALFGIAFQDSATIPNTNAIVNCSNFSPLDQSVNNYDTIYQQRNAVQVPAFWVFPVTMFALYINDGDMLLYTNSNGGFSGFILNVRRYPVGRSIGLPTALLV